MESEVEFRVGDRVVAMSMITECGYEEVDPRAEPCHLGWLHAAPGDLGWVIHVDGDGCPTVRFERIGTATLVSDVEVALIAPILRMPEA